MSVMDSTVIAAAISACAIVASGLLTLWVTGRQEAARRAAAAQDRKVELERLEAERVRAECLRIADEFYGLIDWFAGFPVDSGWHEMWGVFQEQKAEVFDNSVRKVIAIGGPADLRAKILDVLEALPHVELYAVYAWRSDYEELIGLLRLGGDMAADAARGASGMSDANYRDLVRLRDDHVEPELSRARQQGSGS